ncbi:type IV pilus biogenesis/stability protein PilW [Coralloluteibacterium stylophorae]|uniref:Type IV pilus biogenesis/stability protein PilW n=1 Tax=Coralloluteibacterium stylophorae TaxID=1776034 RepID=A0A8J7VW26_9GAMM|nr:type IV pilus biogenesis/stability protein PilW [Coralloluteibacterium stylophorae]MBS7455968.1 type IV pilus biogenesis/stability protein PilW [Coralloluteibacterium stylophorae]
MPLRRRLLLASVALALGACGKPSMLMEPNAQFEPVERPRASLPQAKSDPARAAETQIALAQGYLQRGDYEVAVKRLERALELDPKSAGAHTVLGIVYERIDRPALAGEHYERATRLSPDEGAVLNNYGAWLCRNGRAPEADAWFARALADPFYKSRAGALENAGTCALQAGNLAGAEQYFRKSLELRPNDPGALAQLAALSYRAGDHLSARAFLQRREAAGPLDAPTLDLGSRIEQALGDTQAASRYRERLRDEFPDYTATASGG